MRVLQHWTRSILASGSTRILDENAKRKAIILSPPPANAYEINFLSAAALGGGIRIPAGIRPVILTERELGDAIRGVVNAIAESNPQTVGITELVET